MRLLAARALVALLALTILAPPGSLGFVFLAVLITTLSHLVPVDPSDRRFALLVGASVSLAALAGIASPGTCFVLAVLLMSRLRRSLFGLTALAVPLGVFQTSILQAATQILASAVGSWNSRLVAAPVVLTALLVIWRRISLAAGIGCALATLFIAQVMRETGGSGLQQLVSALPVVAAIAIQRAQIPQSKFIGHVRWAALALSLAASWFLTPPRLFESVGVLPPDRPNAFESKEYRATAAILELNGMTVHEWKDPSVIPFGSLVLVPAIAQSALSRETWDALLRVGANRQLTLLTAAEHTDFGGIASRLNRAASGVVVVSDTTVPPGNEDRPRGLRSTVLGAFPPHAHMNRGASFDLTSFASKVLLFGAGWQSDLAPSSAPGALGDYLLSRDESRGSLLLAAVSVGWPRIVVLGDTTPLMDDFIVADPRVVGWLMKNASLLPLVALDAALLCVLLMTGGVIGSDPLGGHLKTGHAWTGQNRPYGCTRDGLPLALCAGLLQG